MAAGTLISLALVLFAMSAYAGEIHVAVRDGNKSKVESMLKDSPQLINSQDNQYLSTPLHIAAHDGRVEIASLLIEKGANIETKDRDGSTPIFQAALRGHSEVISILLKAGANPNAIADEKVRPLHLAAMNGHVAAVRFLLEGGADPNVSDVQGMTPLAFARDFKNRALIDLLVSKGAK